MGRHYSTRDFFRQMPNDLLARYFAARGVLAELDFAGMKETQTGGAVCSMAGTAGEPAQRDGCRLPRDSRTEL